jgi:hypothetical protein
MKDNIAFVFISFVFMVVGRKVGWWLSKLIFYPAPAVISFINLIGWGVVVAVGMDVLIGWLHPNVVIMSCLNWKWRERSSVKITERTYEKRAQALHR